MANLDALCRALLPQNHIQRIRFFTARVKSRSHDPTQAQRQQTYFRALATIPHLTSHYGQYERRKVYRPFVHPPDPDNPLVQVYWDEEKGSDVNLATFLLLDGFQQQYEVAAVISGDSDLVEPVRAVRDVLSLSVGIFNPRQRAGTELAQVATFYKPLDSAILAACQFPTIMTDQHGTFTKPASW